MQEIMDGVLRFSTEQRNRVGMKTVCKRCGKQVEEAHFIGVIRNGLPNMILHESCWDGSGGILD